MATGVPISVTRMRRSRSCARTRPSRSWVTQCARNSTSSRQFPTLASNARRAAAIARSKSAGPPSAATPATSWVAGLITSKVAPADAPASSPSISSRSSPASTPVPPSASVVVMDAPSSRRKDEVFGCGVAGRAVSGPRSLAGRKLRIGRPGGASRSGGLPVDRQLPAGVEAGHLGQGAAEDRGPVLVGDGAVEVLGDGLVGAVEGALGVRVVVAPDHRAHPGDVPGLHRHRVVGELDVELPPHVIGRPERVGPLLVDVEQPAHGRLVKGRLALLPEAEPPVRVLAGAAAP